MLGQSTQIERSTVEQVREKIAALREQTREAQAAKTYDFERRLGEIKAKEDTLRQERKAKKKAAKESQRLEMIKDVDMEEQGAMSSMMGFAGFGTSKK
jgi:U4/U6.U5 tri-snRNP component SNU23